MGHLFKGVCYPTQQDARQAACSAQNLTWGSGPDLYVATCQDVAATQMNVQVCTSAACTIQQLPWPDTPECDFSGAADLGYEWFLSAMFLLSLVWGSKRLIHLFSGDYG